MLERQQMIDIKKESLKEKVLYYRSSGYRLVQIGCTSLENTTEINYSFDKEQEFVNLKVTLEGSDNALESVSGIYWNAFIYENEMHDLFGIEVKGIAVDYKGNFLKTAVKAPFKFRKNEGKVEE